MNINNYRLEGTPRGRKMVTMKKKSDHTFDCFVLLRMLKKTVKMKRDLF